MTLEQIKTKANSGDRRAQAVLAGRYEIGFEVRESKKQALAWYRKSAEQGFVISQVRLATLSEDEEEKSHWYRVAAEGGVLDAQKALASMLSEEDPEEAVYWYELAAKSGDAESYYDLAKLYEEGNGVPKNDIEAFCNYLQAEKFGFGSEASYEVGSCFAHGQGVDKNCDEALNRLLPIADPRTTENLWKMSISQMLVAVVFADREQPKHDLIEAYAWLSLSSTYGGMSRESAVAARDFISGSLTKEQLQDGQRRAAELFIPRKQIERRLGIS